MAGSDQKKSAVVITPTIGSDTLLDAVMSVQGQSYGNVKHLVVIDGREYVERAKKLLANFRLKNFQVTLTPQNTGGGGFYGHRIYAAYPHLVNEDYVFFLDEDNWYREDHVESAVEALEKYNWDWAHSLRTIHAPDGTLLLRDDCESLGKWPAYVNENVYHVDTSAFMFKRDVLINFCSNIHFGWGGDRRLFSSLIRKYNFENWGTNGRYTLCYRLDGNPKSVTEQFFKSGNQKMAEKYQGHYPWSKE